MSSLYFLYYLAVVHYMGTAHFTCSMVSGHLCCFQFLLAVITAPVNTCGVSVLDALGYIPHSRFSRNIENLFNILRK